MWKIEAPNKEYKTDSFELDFSSGVVVTENEWAAGWFSGREGFKVSLVEGDEEDSSAKKTKAGSVK